MGSRWRCSFRTLTHPGPEVGVVWQGYQLCQPPCPWLNCTGVCRSVLLLGDLGGLGSLAACSVLTQPHLSCYLQCFCEGHGHYALSPSSLITVHNQCPFLVSEERQPPASLPVTPRHQAGGGTLEASSGHGADEASAGWPHPLWSAWGGEGGERLHGALSGSGLCLPLHLGGI